MMADCGCVIHCPLHTAAEEMRDTLARAEGALRELLRENKRFKNAVDLLVKSEHPDEPFCGWCGRAKFSYSSVASIRRQLGEPEGYAPCSNERCPIGKRYEVVEKV